MEAATKNRKDYSLCALAVAFLVLAALVAHSRWHWLIIHPFPLDYGGFYYLQEASTRAATGYGYYHAFSPFFAFMALLVRWTSPMVAYNLIVFGSFCLFAIALGLTALLRSSAWIGAALCFLILQTEPFFFAHYAYLKQSSAMALFALGLFLLEVSNTRERSRRAYLMASFGMFIIAALFHRFAAVAALITLLSSPGRRSSKFLIFSLITLGAFAAAYAWFSPKHLLGHLTWPGPPAWEAMRNHGTLSELEALQFRLYAAMACLLVLTGVWTRAQLPWLLWCGCFVLILPVWRMAGGFWYRFPLSALWLFFTALALSLHKTNETKGSKILNRYILYLFILCATAIVSTVPATNRPIGPPMRIETLMQNAARLKAWVPDKALVKTLHGIQFRVTYILNRTATSRQIKDAPPLLYSLKNERPPELSCRPIWTIEGPIPQETACLQLEDQWFIWKETREKSTQHGAEPGNTPP